MESSTVVGGGSTPGPPTSNDGGRMGPGTGIKLMVALEVVPGATRFATGFPIDVERALGPEVEPEAERVSTLRSQLSDAVPVMGCRYMGGSWLMMKAAPKGEVAVKARKSAPDRSSRVQDSLDIGSSEQHRIPIGRRGRCEFIDVLVVYRMQLEHGVHVEI